MRSTFQGNTPNEVKLPTKPHLPIAPPWAHPINKHLASNPQQLSCMNYPILFLLSSENNNKSEKRMEFKDIHKQNTRAKLTLVMTRIKYLKQQLKSLHGFPLLTRISWPHSPVPLGGFVLMAGCIAFVFLNRNVFISKKPLNLPASL